MAFDFASQNEIASSWHYLGEDTNVPKSAFEAHTAIEEGLPASMLRHFKSVVGGLSNEVWANIMNVSLSTIKDLAKKDRLSVQLSSQMVLFAVLLARAEDVFGGKEAALKWFSEEQMALSGRKPIDLLDTFVGANLVSRTLIQIDRGVYV
ncbi:MAG: antitoxin Xre/MbcA/ParS toxin-binding domain-containing protein [Pseudomonadota bacterium]